MMKNNIDESKIIIRYKNIYDYKGNKEFRKKIKKQFKNASEDEYWKNQMREWKDIL